jgi:hypothetical protein
VALQADDAEAEVAWLPLHMRGDDQAAESVAASIASLDLPDGAIARARTGRSIELGAQRLIIDVAIAAGGWVASGIVSALVSDLWQRLRMQGHEGTLMWSQLELEYVDHLARWFLEAMYELNVPQGRLAIGRTGFIQPTGLTLREDRRREDGTWELIYRDPEYQYTIVLRQDAEMPHAIVSQVRRVRIT